MATHTYRDTLRQPGLQPFLWTQFLGAFNDNLFKIIVSMLVVRAAASGSAGLFGVELTPGLGLALAGAVFIVPFLLFSGYAGSLADIYSKRTVLIVTKSLEIVTALLAMPALVLGRLDLALIVLFLFALQATFFSPAKYAILPEFLPDRDLSRANGLLEMSTFVAIVAGTAVGGYLFGVWSDSAWMLGAAVLAIAVIGTATSFGIARVPAAVPGGRMNLNPWGEIAHGLRHLSRDRVLAHTVLGISYFWFLGSLLQLTTVLFGTDVLQLDDRWVGMLGAFAAVGIGVGSIMAGRLSGDKVELGLAPVGSIGMGMFAIFLSRSTGSFGWAAFNMTVVGFFAGLFAVPLNALLQQRGESHEKGRLIATNNFLNMLAVMLASAALWVCTDVLNLSADRIFLIFGGLTLVSSLYILSVVPEFTIRFVVWLLTHTVYKIRIEGAEHVPNKGPALIICNHISFVDPLLVGGCVQRFIRFIVYRPYWEHPALNWLMRMMHAIPASASRRDIVASLEAAREELRRGHVVCIFAEGAVSRTGNLLPFKRGFERIVEGLDVPIVPVYLDRVWGSIFSFKGRKFFWKRPTAFPFPVTVAFGRPLPSSTKATDARLAMMELGAEVAQRRHSPDDTLPRHFVKTARRRFFSFAMADSTGRTLTFGRALAASLLLAKWIRTRTANEPNLGLLLPSSVGGALANLGASLAGRVPVNLNFTAGTESMTHAIAQCGITTIITSKQFVTKAALPTLPGMVYLEDILPVLMKPAAMATTFLQALLLPTSLLIRMAGGGGVRADDTATVIFSSGSTGVPKGVMLSHRNVLANLDAVEQVVEVRNDDMLIGVLPFFHSFGFTGTLWFPLTSGFGVVYHPNPMDAKTVGDLAEKYKGTMLISTPTFCASYVRKCKPEQLQGLRYAIVGAEKLREPVAQAFKEKFGVDLLEGYGCTEMAPVVCANLPNVNDQGEFQVGIKTGSVGHPLPGVVAKVVDPDTGEGPLIGAPGLLLVKGPNRMQGYLGEPRRTQEALRDGWYVTGDIAVIDEDGFIFITDRLSRFSKIAGEMVPHMKVEESIVACLGETQSAVVTSIPDDSKGERLIAFYTDPDVTAQALWEQLCRTELPKLWIPKREDLRFVETIPTLGTGKVDLRGVRKLALDTLEEAAS